MLIIDRTQRDWAVVSLLVTTVGGAVYVVYSTSSLNGPSGGSVPGLVFGILAAGMMIFAGLLAARRRFPAARMGSAQFWLRGHLWIGTLTIPFALFHAGFGVGGPVEWMLWVLFFAIVLSGFWGLFLQQMLPRMMLEQLPRETFVEQIPHLCAKYSAESDRLLAEVCGPLELPLSQGELSHLRPYLVPFFEEDRKKNRNDYPKNVPDAQQLDIYLAKIYAGVKPSISKPTAEVKPPAVAVPTIPAVARTTTIEEPAPATTASAVIAAAAENPSLTQPALVPAATAAPLSKPDPRTLLAAARARKEGTAGTPAPAASTAPPSALPAATGKPDPKAMLAAMKAKKEAASGSSTIEATGPVEVTATPATVKDSPVERASAPPPAAKANLPSPTQIAELKQMYLELIRPQLPLQPATRAWVDAIRRSALACHVRQEVLHPLLVPIFDQLRDVCEQRKQFAFVIRYQRWLHGWLLIHIPATVALYVILLVHAVSALRVTPFGN